jgi:N12 class adenine-specific DNA methylase
MDWIECGNAARQLSVAPGSGPYPDLFADAPSPPSADYAEPIRAWRPSTPLSPTTRNEIDWPAWCDDTLDGLDGLVTKFDANLDAIGALAAVEREGRTASQEERAAMLRFTGWGGMPGSFEHESGEAAWRARASRLRALLSEEDYEFALASVNTSHYTEPAVIHWVWSLLQRMGFDGGSILEPSAGVGHFLGCMPPAIARRSRVTAIELDRVAGRMLGALYAPLGVDVRKCGFEAAALADGSYDLVVTNVPFGRYGVRDDRNRPYSRASIHNWFIGRALDAIRPGGLVCCITSSYFMDSGEDAMRAHVASQADLVTAFRLPAGSFERLGSTHVQADLVVLRKRLAGEKPSEDEWLDREQVPQPMIAPGCYASGMLINRWFVKHPGHVLGFIDRVSNGWEAVPTATLDGDLGEAMSRAADLVSAGVYAPRDESFPVATSAAVDVERTHRTRQGAFVLVDGRIGVDDGSGVEDVNEKLRAADRVRIAGMVAIRDGARELLRAQLVETADAVLAKLRRELNASYDRFVAKHGLLSSRANASAFRRDPDYPLLLSLEYYDEEDGAARKADIFFKRTVSPVREATTAEHPDQALALSMQWRGRVDPEYMAGLLASSEDEVLGDLAARGMIFRNPETQQYETADEYLAGDVKRKLMVAMAAGEAYGANVLALRGVVPEDILPGNIAVRLGAVWIPADVVQRFVAEVLSLGDVTVEYQALAGAWAVTYDDWRAKQSVACFQDYGTRRLHALDLLQQALNMQTPTVRDPHPTKDGAYVVNKDETLAAREKLALIRERFATWVYEDDSRRDRLCRIYNDLFNRTRLREFDGSHLLLPGFSHCFELLSSQRDAIWRIVQSGNTGLFHAVGAGKTAIMGAASMELRRLGLARKPVHVVPNHCLEQYTAELVRLYPAASVLMATKDDLARGSRREFVARVATGDWDAIVMTHSTFELLPMSASFTKLFIRDVIREIEMAVRACRSGARSNSIVKQLERMKKVWHLRLERLDNQARKDDFLCWEALGIDWIAYDESQAAKNLFRHTKMTRVAGLPLCNSQRSFDLYLKTRYTMGLYRGQQRGVVLATATPIANTMAEVHTFQRFLQPNTLRELGLEQFDAWAATFGEAVTALEIAPDGSGYRIATRFARFVNVPDLMAIFCDVSDIRTRDMLKLPVPALKGGRPETVACEASAALRAFVETLVERAERMRKERVDPKKDNMLLITNEGRLAALDMRLVNPRLPADPKGKVARCAAEVVRVWRATEGFRGAQLVFCDASTPKAGAGFTVYGALREALIASGIPAEQVAFVHDADTDAQKARLFRQVREGRVRVVLGSTQKLGTGTNVQRRLAALHELDCPWRPCDVEQREGRILRQGNECEEVEILRYVTEGSFDAYSWQTVETKARFIVQVMSGDKGVRTIEDVALATLTYAEVKALASGNPRVIEKAGVDAEVAKYATLLSVWRNQRHASQGDVARLPMAIERCERELQALDADAARAGDQREANLAAEVHGQVVRGRQAIGEALRTIVRDANASEYLAAMDQVVGKVGDFTLRMRCDSSPKVAVLVLRGDAEHVCSQRRAADALFDELVATLTGIARRRDACAEDLRLMRAKLDGLSAELQRPFEHQDRLAALIARQRALDAELDIGNDEFGSAAVDDTAEKLAA